MAKKADLQYYGTGKRKSSIARVYVTAGSGKIVVNGHPVEEYMPWMHLSIISTGYFSIIVPAVRVRNPPA